MTFTERCRNQETSHLDDDPLFVFLFFGFLNGLNCFGQPAR